ncbi:MAG: PleD family two-component system response regulator [Pseudomonadota bacterium]
MTARILVVDDLEPNVKLLEAKLMAEYFEVVTAMSGADALTIAAEEQPDIVLLDVMMPEMDGFEVCRHLKNNPATEHIPVVMVTALDQQSDRVAGLEAGADDFLTKPVEDVALFARVKSLTRLKMMTDELRLRESTSAELGLLPDDARQMDDEKVAHILVIDDDARQAEKVKFGIGEPHVVAIESDEVAAIALSRDNDYDLIIVNLNRQEGDGLRLCSQLRSLEQTRHTPVLIAVQKDDVKRLVRALEMGVNDYLVKPIDPNELSARVRTQLRRKRYTERLQTNFQLSLEVAVTDTLTGLYNRRYLANHLRALFDSMTAKKRPLSVMFLDIDYFKKINDSYGHDAGDLVLKEFARRLSSNVRGIDLACRYGGEEFVVVMPDTDQGFAYMVAERLRQDIADEPVSLGESEADLNVTVSIGIATSGAGSGIESPQDLIQRADEALYDAKNGGRNRVVADAA